MSLELAVGTLFAAIADGRRREHRLRQVLEEKKLLLILKHPDPRLRDHCLPVTEFTNPNLQNLGEEMLACIGPIYDTCKTTVPHEHDRFCQRLLRKQVGVGLAAPQVGVPLRLIVLMVPGYSSMMLANPVITKMKGEELGEEGCLSLPGVRKDVKRATTVWLEYQTVVATEKEPAGTKKTMKAKDFLARVIQHEVDHLDGIEFIDRTEE